MARISMTMTENERAVERLARELIDKGRVVLPPTLGLTDLGLSCCGGTVFMDAGDKVFELPPDQARVLAEFLLTAIGEPPPSEEMPIMQVTDKLDDALMEWARGDNVLRFGQFAVFRLQDYLRGPNPDIFYEPDARVAYRKLRALLAEPVNTP